MSDQQGPSNDRRTRLLQLGVVVFFLSIIIVVVLILAVSSGGGSGGDASSLVEKARVEKLLSGIPQNATALGKESAPVRLFEYGDLQCPFCKEYSEGIVPEIIEHWVRRGEVSITFRNFVIIGPQSIPAGEAAIAAGAQGKAWNFIETWYRNQGEENSGYATDEFIEAMARYVDIPDFARWKKEWKSGKYKRKVEDTTRQAEKLGFEGTPFFAIEGPNSNGIELLGAPRTSGEFGDAIRGAS